MDCIFVLICLFFYQAVSGKSSEKFDKAFFETQYDNTIRPGAKEDNVTTVEVWFHVNTIGSVSDISMDYVLDIYLNQRWHDPRLSFNATRRVFLNQHTHKNIWWPDTYFHNAKAGEKHEITTANEYVHLLPNGSVTVSQRLSLLLNCFMDLRNFPMDTQKCHVILGSYGYVDEELHYQFVSDSSITFNTDVTLPEFRVDREHVTHTYSKTLFPAGNYSTLTFTFRLERDFGYYLIQTYIPSIMVVILSWVNFWLDVYATPARISLGLLTVLTMCTQISGINAQLPRVSYIKAIDVWMSTCLLFVFGALLEFAVVNVVTRRDEVKAASDLEKQNEAEGGLATSEDIEEMPEERNAETDDDVSNVAEKGEPRKPRFGAAVARVMQQRNAEGDDSDGNQRRDQRKLGFEMAVTRLLQQRRDALKIRNARRIEKTCRLAFPVLFGIFTMFYWLNYWCRWFTVPHRCKA